MHRNATNSIMQEPSGQSRSSAGKIQGKILKRDGGRTYRLRNIKLQYEPYGPYIKYLEKIIKK